MNKNIEENTNLLKNYKFIILNLMNPSILTDIDRERKVIEDAVLELKQEYL